MLDDVVLNKIRDSLLEIAKEILPKEYFSAKTAEAADLIVSDRSGYAFLLACCLDRGTKAEIIWSIPYEIKLRLGHIDPGRISLMRKEELASIIKALDNKPRYINDAPRTVYELTNIVMEECGGQAFRIWDGKRLNDVKRILLSIHGVGPGIANMTVLLIEKAFRYRFDEEDRKRMDIKPDVHAMRVLYRLGLNSICSDTEAVLAARALNPECPGAVDGPLWWIGRNFCHPRKPDCRSCPVDNLCKKRLED